MGDYRHTPYTLELHAQFLQKLAALGYIEHACDAVGLKVSTMRSWIRQGEKGKEPYATLVADVRRVRAEVMGTLRTNVPMFPGGAKWLLEKMDQRVYGGKQDLRGAVQALVDVVLPRMSDEAGAELIDALEQYERELSGERGVLGAEEAGAGEEVVDTTAEVCEPARLGSGSDSD